MTEKLAAPYILYLLKTTYPSQTQELARHWFELQTKRGDAILNIKKSIDEMHLVAPYYYCTPIKPVHSQGWDFDFGGKPQIDLSAALYLAVCYGQITYSSDGKLVIAPAGQTVIKPPLTWESRGHYFPLPDKIVSLSENDPAAKLYQRTKKLLDPDGLISGTDNAFLLSLATKEAFPNPKLFDILSLTL